jgi:hypothetical protein
VGDWGVTEAVHIFMRSPQGDSPVDGGDELRQVFAHATLSAGTGVGVPTSRSVC